MGKNLCPDCGGIKKDQSRSTINPTKLICAQNQLMMIASAGFYIEKNAFISKFNFLLSSRFWPFSDFVKILIHPCGQFNNKFDYAECDLGIRSRSLILWWVFSRRIFDITILLSTLISHSMQKLAFLLLMIIDFLFIYAWMCVMV